jgi:hypothetical protein
MVVTVTIRTQHKYVRVAFYFVTTWLPFLTAIVSFMYQITDVNLTGRNITTIRFSSQYHPNSFAAKNPLSVGGHLGWSQYFK